jgi:flagellar basal-body rod protein FlgF
MAAAAARAEQLDSIADNLANAETPGYKATRPAFQSFLPPYKGPGLVDKVFATVVSTGTDMSPGAVVTTDNPLDILPGGETFLSVASQSGKPAFTRNGRLSLNPDGVLVSDGRAVMGVTGKQITAAPGANLTINEAGDVRADGSIIDRLALFQLQGNIVRVGPQLYGPGPGGTAAQVEGQVSTGQLEMGNVSPIDSTIALINAQRQFESAMQAIQTYRQLDTKANEVGRSR